MSNMATSLKKLTVTRESPKQCKFYKEACVSNMEGIKKKEGVINFQIQERFQMGKDI